MKNELSDCSCRNSLIWVCTVCPGISVQKLRIITVKCFHYLLGSYNAPINIFAQRGRGVGIHEWEVDDYLICNNYILYLEVLK